MNAMQLDHLENALNKAEQEGFRVVASHTLSHTVRNADLILFLD